MKSTLKGKIFSIEKDSHSHGVVLLKVNAIGKVDTKLLNAQEVSFNGTLILKQVIADEMKIGATLTITVSDDEPTERK